MNNTKSWNELTKEVFKENINHTYTLNLAISILEDRKELIDKNLDLQKENAKLKEQLHEASLDIQELTEKDIWCPTNCDKLMRYENNWNELKEWLKKEEKEYRKDIYSSEYGWIIGTMLGILDKMQELEKK